MIESFVFPVTWSLANKDCFIAYKMHDFCWMQKTGTSLLCTHQGSESDMAQSTMNFFANGALVAGCSSEEMESLGSGCCWWICQCTPLSPQGFLSQLQHVGNSAPSSCALKGQHSCHQPGCVRAHFCMAVPQLLFTEPTEINRLLADSFILCYCPYYQLEKFFKVQFWNR